MDDKIIEEPCKEKTKMWNTYLGAKSFSNLTLYTKICNSVTNAVKIAKINLEYKLVDDMRDNLKAFLKYVRLTQKTKENEADLRNCKNGIYAITSVSKAKILNNFFDRIFTEENMNAIPNPDIFCIQNALNCLSITHEIG